ncbi:MAG TPA: NAD(P)/FAD-dependent oxidoreductase [Bacteroidales bacterium]|nr:NAD(P)/FAD-dependent oxidoreductase [Bacteroidales bacterium]HPS17028.1 NAD(P)/FAD-dependent oxidoreductase [Bacteroidales bacterium]
MINDVVIIGGGPAGIMAGIFAAQNGAKVLLLEKMREPLRKLKITGKGRCNITNTAPMAAFLTETGPQPNFLKPSFLRFFNDDTVAFFEQIGVKTVVERGGRVFPESNSAVDVANKMLDYARSCGVEIRCNSKIKRFITEENKVTAVEVAPNEIIYGKTFILATGGASYPATGSSGEGYPIARNLGHQVTPIRPALVPVETKGDSAKNLQGLSLINVKVNVWIDGKKAGDEFGEMLFTHFGLSGPIILTLSRRFNDAIQQKKKIIFSIDLKPALDEQKLDNRLQRDLDENGKMKLVNIFRKWLPAKLIPEFIRLLNLDGEKIAGQIKSEERKKIRLLLKDFRFEVTALRPFSEAIITSGGISLEQINSKTLASKIYPNLFFAGEVLDLDANTGGYNLQIAFSTGVLAGEQAAWMALG